MDYRQNNISQTRKSEGLVMNRISDFFFAPIRDHRGWETPSEGSRLLFIVVILATSIWAWPLSQGMIFVWFFSVLLVSTPILALGWWIFSIIGQNRESRFLAPSVDQSSNN